MQAASGEVELLVGLRVALWARHGTAPEQHERRREPLEIAVAGVQHGQPRHLRLDRHAHLDQLQRAGLLGDLMLLDRLPIGDEGAAADAALHQLLVGQLPQRLADGRRRDAL